MIRILSFFLLLFGMARSAPLVRETVAEGFYDPMQLAIAPDGGLHVIEREGRILRVDPASGIVSPVGNLAVEALRAKDPDSDYAREDGLQAIAFDPEHAKNQRVFLYYSAPEKSVDRLSRFTFRAGILDPASERILLEIPIQRDKRVCHHGGSLEFGPDGLLYLSVGDNTNPFDSKGSAPIDDRPDRAHADAMRSAGNTNDLRGKILRIRPTETGYEIPPGNLFPPGTAGTRPEIYIMGCRNPFRLSLDPKTRTLYWGEVGPDAKADSEAGPAGHDEINQAKAAGNFGWPFVIADHKPYSILDFTTGKVLSTTDPAAPLNPGIRNTGLRVLPPARPAFIWYTYQESAEFPILGSGGRNAMAGPVFHHEPGRMHNLLPAEDDHSLVMYDWLRGKIWKAKLHADESLAKIDLLQEGLTHPIDMEMDRDGALWVLEYGSDWWFNKDGKILRLLPAATAAAGMPVTLGRVPAPAGDAAPALTLGLAGDPSSLGFGKSVAFTIGGKTLPDAAKTVVRARYIPAGGHDAGGPMFTTATAALITSKQCLACHQVDHASVGPRYLDVSLKYRGQADAARILKAKLKSGGAGVWGEVPMPPQVGLADEDSDTIVRAILGLGEGISETRGSLSGTLRLAPRPADAEPGGAWEISAEAPGFSPAKFRLTAE